jgi:hypothetical protein
MVAPPWLLAQTRIVCVSTVPTIAGQTHFGDDVTKAQLHCVSPAEQGPLSSWLAS